MAAAAALLGLPLAAGAQARGDDGRGHAAPPPNHAAAHVDAHRGGGGGGGGGGQMAPRREFGGQLMAPRRDFDARQGFAESRQGFRGDGAFRGDSAFRGNGAFRAQGAFRDNGAVRVARADGLRGGDRRGDRFGVGDRRRFRDHDRLRFGIGVAYAGYPYGYDDGAGYYDDGDAYSYPDDQGYYQPFDYDDGDAQGYVGYGGGAYDAGGYGDDQADQQVYDQSGYDQNGYDQGGYDEGAAPAYGDDGGARGWSAGAPPADCGSWVWRDRAQRYQWVAAPCPCPPGQQGW
jgi:hypothetical protein